MGKGALVSCLAKFLHPSKEIEKAFVNRRDNLRLNQLYVLREDIKTVRQKETNCVVLRSDNVMNGDVHIELYAPHKHFSDQFRSQRV